MGKLIKALVFVACGLFSATAALAAPVLLYTFETTSIACDNSHGTIPNCNSMLSLERQQLNTMYIGLSPSALSNGSATLNYFFPLGGGFSAPTVNIGVELMSIYLYQTGNFTKVLPNGFVISPKDQSNYLLTDISLTVGRYLTGSLYVQDYQSSIQMFTPTGETEWRGRYNSDALNQNIIFTGNWRFSNVVSEPGTVALFLAALAIMATASRRRITPTFHKRRA